MAKQTYEEGREHYNNFCKQLRTEVINDIKIILDNNNDAKTYSKKRVEESFEDMLLHTLNFITNVYDIDTNWNEISEDIILKLTYSKDGKTFYDRIDEHYSDYLINKDQNIFLNAIDSIMNTESKHIFNHALASDLKDSAIECEIIGDNACDECLDHLGGGRLNPKLLIDLPPYHPNCECSIKYYFKVDNNTELEGINE